VVVCASRLTTIEKADKIAVLQSGSIVELGTHQELMEKGGVYASLVKHKVDEEGSN
jgi:ABC-type multidrug transport system fused ATPase/permease subunit